MAIVKIVIRVEIEMLEFTIFIQDLQHKENNVDVSAF